MTIHKLLQYCINKLKQASIERPDFESEILIAYVIKKDREYIISKANTKINILQAFRAAYLCQKRIQGYPIAYLTKEKHFYNLKFFINKNVLVPRPESELYIDYFKNLDYNNSLNIDVGTGSGALIISLVKNINTDEFKNLKFIATDISYPALKVAKRNAKVNKVDDKISFINSNLLKQLEPGIFNQYQKINILANLPYLNDKEIKENSIKKEPKIALYSPKNGLYHYLELIKELKHLNIKNKQVKVAMEINPQQVKALSYKIKEIFPESQINIIKDYRKQERLLIFKYLNN